MMLGRRQLEEGQRQWAELLGTARCVFTSPSFRLFETLLTGWVIALSRRTVTAMIRSGDPSGTRAHDAYHRFFRDGVWSTTALWKVLVGVLVERLCPQGPITLDLDDTLLHKTGSKVNGADIYRDAVRSTRGTTVCALGLNIVVLTVRINPPWGGCPLALPVGMRLHKKGGPSTVTLAEGMLQELVSWLPQRQFHLAADGAYASLCGSDIANMTITSRIRRDAAVYELAPPPTGRRGRPATRGQRLPTPEAMSEALHDNEMQRHTIDKRGHDATILVLIKTVLWYQVGKSKPLNLLIVRDPTGRQPDDFFITTDIDATGAKIAQRYSGRWSIECTNRDIKQHLGAENPQSWTRQGPERTAMVSLWLYSAIWVWYIPLFATTKTWIPRAWYSHKKTPSFQDALATLRRCLWTHRISCLSPSDPAPQKMTDSILDHLAHAA